MATEVRAGSFVVADEVLTLNDGALVYSTKAKKRRWKFRVGQAQVTPWLDEVVVGMRQGERRWATVPAHLNKASDHLAKVPPGVKLKSEIRLIKILRH